MDANTFENLLLVLAPVVVLSGTAVAGVWECRRRRRARARGVLPTDVYADSLEHAIDQMRAHELELRAKAVEAEAEKILLAEWLRLGNAQQ